MTTASCQRETVSMKVLLCHAAAPRRLVRLLADGLTPLGFRVFENAELLLNWSGDLSTALAESEATITLDAKTATSELPTIRITKFARGMLPELPAIDTPFALDLSYSEASNADMERIRHLENLSYLSLGKTLVTDDGLATLCELRNLRTLWLLD